MWEVNVDLAKIYQCVKKVCPYCGGLGKLRAKRKAMQLNGPPVDYDEVHVKCPHCNGTGFKE